VGFHVDIVHAYYSFKVLYSFFQLFSLILVFGAWSR